MLLRRIKSNSTDLSTVVTMIRSDTGKYDTFIKATQELAKHVAILFPIDSFNGIGKHPRKRKISAANRNGGGTHKIITKQGRKYCNGIDVTDQTRSFTSKEWKSLPFSFKKELYNNPNRKKNKPSPGDREASDVTTNNATLDNETIGRIVSGVSRAALAQADTPGTVTIPRPPRMGAGGATQRQAAAAETNSSGASVITNDTRWDHNGNIINN
jgi:hypothetical protein